MLSTACVSLLYGKLTVDKNADELLSRTRVHGVKCHKITEAETREIEPRVRIRQYDLFSPATAIIDPREVVSAFVINAGRKGLQILDSGRYSGC